MKDGIATKSRNPLGPSAPLPGSANLGEFTDGYGQVRQCRVLWKTRKGVRVLKIQYVARNKTVIGFIAPHEFRPDSPNDQGER